MSALTGFLVAWSLIGGVVMGCAIASEEGENGNEGWGVVGRIAFAFLGGALIGAPMIVWAGCSLAWSSFRTPSRRPTAGGSE